MHRWVVIVVAILRVSSLLANLDTIDLTGQWEVSDEATGQWFTATVPGCIHTDLMANHVIPDPFFRDYEHHLQWISDRAWKYRSDFDVPDDFLEHNHIYLHFEGLDTLATIRVNGQPVGSTDNMFRSWDFNIKRFLKSGFNRIEVRFKSVLPLIQAKEAVWPLPTSTYPGLGYIRKMPCSFGWDSGPTLITCGIWRPVSLVAYDVARIEDCLILQDHTLTNTVGLQIHVTAKLFPLEFSDLKPELIVRTSVYTPEGDLVQKIDGKLQDGQSVAELTIPSPRLWWPVGMGDQPLYRVNVELLDRHHYLLDTWTTRIGLRTLGLEKPTEEKPLHFVVNKVPFFAKGANWIPADVFPNRATQDRLQHLIEDARAANMNCLRLWGGGYYEDDRLFDLCDELGICVWIDFPFSSTAYPSFDANFLKNVKQEVRDQIRRLRHHPCIAVWSGNHEVSQFCGDKTWTSEKMSAIDYDKLFRETIGSEMATLAPQSDYVTGSSDSGDQHYWKVWHQDKLFESYRQVHGFISEFGFQSFPVPATVHSFTLPEDRESVYSTVMKWHERSGRMHVDAAEDGTLGTDKIMHMMSTYFRPPKDFENTLWLSQITQAFGIEYAVEGWRREMPKSMGCLFWQYNDTWPGTSWSSVDYFGRWKALQFRARHFFAPILVSGVTVSSNHIAIWITNDQLKTPSGQLTWCVTDLKGVEIIKGQQDIQIPASQSNRIAMIGVNDLLHHYGSNQLLVWLKLLVDGKPVSDNILLFTKPKQLKLINPKLEAQVEGDEMSSEFHVVVKATYPALWTWLDISSLDPDARYSDNFVHIRPHEPLRFEVKLTQPVSKQTFKQALKLHSLFDTYEHAF